jgi:hypothetical protein
VTELAKTGKRPATDRTFRDVANEFERWRDRARVLDGIGEWEHAWHLRGGGVVVIDGLDEHIMVNPGGRYRPLVTIPPVAPGAVREAMFRAACEELDRERGEQLASA